MGWFNVQETPAAEGALDGTPGPPELPPLGPESSRAQREPVGWLSTRGSRERMPQLHVGLPGIGVSGSWSVCELPSVPAPCRPPSCAPGAVQPRTALLPWPRGHGPGRDGEIAKAHSQGKACPTRARSGGQLPRPAPKHDPLSPQETQRDEA